MTKEANSQVNAERIWRMIKDIDFCMLVTNPEHGKMRSRPMSSIVDVERHTLHILADKTGKVDEEIAANSSVLLTFSNGKSHVSVAADCRVSTDLALIKSLWNPGAQAFWPKGPDVEPVVALIIIPTYGEFWEGSNRIIAAAKFAVALASGTTPDLGDSGRAKL